MLKLKMLDFIICIHYQRFKNNKVFILVAKYLPDLSKHAIVACNLKFRFKAIKLVKH